MLLSMTGYGAGQSDDGDTTVTAEIRAVNNRYLKLHTRLPDGYAAIEPQVEELVRKHVRRGSVQLNIDVRRAGASDDFQINRELIVSYYGQLKELSRELQEDSPIRLDALLALPGAIQDVKGNRQGAEHDWPLIKQAIREALEELRRMRQTEGAAMAEDLAIQVDDIGRCADEVANRTPRVVEAYQTRLTERLKKLLTQHNIESQPVDIIREVGIFAERADISEEIVRLRSHLEQFCHIMSEPAAGAGRKLDFLVQELLRETNTIGSKANDAEIARHVVHAKTCIERIREMVQNVE